MTDSDEKDEKKQDTKANSRSRSFDGEFSKSRSRDENAALGGERSDMPDDAEHVTMTPKHVPKRMRSKDKSDSDDE